MSVLKCTSCHTYVLPYTTLPPSHDYGFVTTGALGHTDVRLHVAGNRESKSASVTTAATSIINIECGLKKHNCTTCHKAIMAMTGRACFILILNKKSFSIYIYLLMFSVKAICLYSVSLKSEIMPS